MVLRKRGDAHLWPFGVIPYRINNEDFPEGSPERAEIEGGINIVNRRTNITLINQTIESDFVEFVQSEEVCQSPVGRRGGVQPIGCASDLEFDSQSIVHEILHSAGFYHEHQRFDRDNFVTIDFGNIPEERRRVDFERVFCPTRRRWISFCNEDADDIGDYDFISIMHYDRRAQAIDPTRDTITPLDSTITRVGGNSLSGRDITGIATVYPFKAVPGWFGADSRGMSIAIGNIRPGGGPDLLMLHVHNGRAGDIGYYRIGWGLNQNGLPQDGWTDRIEINNPFGQQSRDDPTQIEGLGVTLSDINGNGRSDLIVVHIVERGGRKAFYRIGRDINPNTGQVSGWTDDIEIPGEIPSPLTDPPDPGLVGYKAKPGIAVRDIDGDDREELVFFYVLPTRGSDTGFYQVGFDLDSQGNIAEWSEKFDIPILFGDITRSADVAITDFNDNGEFDLLLYHIEGGRGGNRAFYLVGSDISPSGEVASWGDQIPLPDILGPNQGGGFAATVLSGRPTFIYSFLHNPPGQNRGIYRTLPVNPDQLPTVGTIETDDEADLIEFIIDHNAVPSDTIEFKLELGPGITWHKGIFIPVTEGTEPYIEAYNDIRADAQISLNVDRIDRSGIFRFQKAMTFGIIEQCGTKPLNEFELPPGSRLTFTWLKDHKAPFW